jgi:hypothetical protein
MRDHEKNRELETTICRALDADIEALDPALEIRLARARRDAVERGLAGRWRLPVFGRFALAGAGALMVALIALSLWTRNKPHRLMVHNPDEFEIITAQEQMELYEDLEFYRWLAQQKKTG